MVTLGRGYLGQGGNKAKHGKEAGGLYLKEGDRLCNRYQN